MVSFEHPLLDEAAQAEVKELLLRTGHLQYPFGEVQALPDNLQAAVDVMQQYDSATAAAMELPEAARLALETLELDEPAMRNAIRSYQHFMVLALEPLIAKHHPDRNTAAPAVDGIIGPSTMELFGQVRCGMPDYAFAEAVGSGQWKSCHDIGNFHGAVVRVMNDPPSHLKRPYKTGTVWDEVKRRCRECYAEIGLRFWFSDDEDAPEGGHQTELSFVSRSGGWIGLALIGQGQQCSSNPIWLRLLATYLQSASITEKYLTLWGNLLIHELGHNCASGHTSGGIMNPGILDVPNTWIGDPAESRMKGWFGGERVPIDDDPPDNPPGPFPGGWTGELTNVATGQKLNLFGLPK